MKFNLYKNGKYYGFGNPNMLRTYTNKEIKAFYKRFNITVKIERDK